MRTIKVRVLVYRSVPHPISATYPVRSVGRNGSRLSGWVTVPSQVRQAVQEDYYANHQTRSDTRT
jgi:hypothetical protein